MIQNREFLGSGWRFPLQVTPGGRIAQARYEQRIEESIVLILSTAPGERPMLQEFGCGIQNTLFAPNDSRTIAVVAHEVRKALTRFEPRLRQEVETLTARLLTEWAAFAQRAGR